MFNISCLNPGKAPFLWSNHKTEVAFTVIALALAIIGALTLAQGAIFRNLPHEVKIVFVSVGGVLALLLGSYLYWKKRSSAIVTTVARAAMPVSPTVAGPSVIPPAAPIVIPSGVPVADLKPKPAPAIPERNPKVPLILPSNPMPFLGPPAPAPLVIQAQQPVGAAPLLSSAVSHLGPQPTPAPVVSSSMQQQLVTTTGKVIDLIKSERIGKGTYGVVISGRVREGDQDIAVVIKIMRDGGDLIYFERETERIQFLNSKKVEHVVQLYGIIKNSPHPIFKRSKDSNKSPHNYAQVFYYSGRTIEELSRAYIYRLSGCRSVAGQLFTCLSKVHQLGITHCDLSSNNIVLNGRDDHLTVIDWGTATSSPISTHSRRAALFCRSPEGLIHKESSNSTVDIWAAACALYQLAMNGEYLFSSWGGDTPTAEIEVLGEITQELGFPSEEYIEKSQYGSVYFNEIRRSYKTNRKKKLISMKQELLAQRDRREKENEIDAFIDLLSKMLVWEPEKRITASAALEHPFFTGKIPVATQPSVKK